MINDIIYFTGLYYGITIAIVSLATAMTVLTLNIHHKGLEGRKVPNVLKVVCLKYCAKLLFLRLPAPIVTNAEVTVTISVPC